MSGLPDLKEINKEISNHMRHYFSEIKENEYQETLLSFLRHKKIFELMQKKNKLLNIFDL